MCFYTAQPVHQILGNHQKVRDAFQPAGGFVGIKLVNGVERLKLDPCFAVQFGKRNLLMDSVDYFLCTGVAVCVTGHNRFITLQQNIIHAPGINR